MGAPGGLFSGAGLPECILCIIRTSRHDRTGPLRLRPKSSESAAWVTLPSKRIITLDIQPRPSICTYPLSGLVFFPLHLQSRHVSHVSARLIVGGGIHSPLNRATFSSANRVSVRSDVYLRIFAAETRKYWHRNGDASLLWPRPQDSLRGRRGWGTRAYEEHSFILQCELERINVLLCRARYLYAAASMFQAVIHSHACCS